MRIITGSARGTRLLTLDGIETRPTGERVKEAVFSMIQFDIEGRRVLDLFAGSGQLGLEALSRGAASATLVDSANEAINIIKTNAQKARLFEKCRVLQSDFKQYLKNSAGKEKFDIVFLDPPYAEHEYIPFSLNALVNGGLLNPNALVICESEQKTGYSAEGLTRLKHVQYGRVCVTLLKNERCGF